MNFYIAIGIVFIVSSYFIWVRFQIDRLIQNTLTGLKIGPGQEIPTPIKEARGEHILAIQEFLLRKNFPIVWDFKRILFFFGFVAWTVFPLFGVGSHIGLHIDDSLYLFITGQTGGDGFFTRNANSITEVKVWVLTSLVYLAALVSALTVSIYDLRYKFCTHGQIDQVEELDN